MPITLTLPDGKELQVPDGATGADAARAIGKRLAEAAVAVRLDGVALDLSRPLHAGSLEVITAASEEGRHVLRHSAAHILAQAVLGLFDGATFAIGPPIEDGFYYDLLHRQATITWIVLALVSTILALGMSWGHLRAAWSGQATVDEIDR